MGTNILDMKLFQQYSYICVYVEAYVYLFQTYVIYFSFSASLSLSVIY